VKVGYYSSCYLIGRSCGVAIGMCGDWYVWRREMEFGTFAIG
jgi:hypothetical protein